MSGYDTDLHSGAETNIPYLIYGYDQLGNDLHDLYKDLEDTGIPNPYSRQGKDQPFGYTGYRHDEISGTYFAQAREYQPQNGRFTAQDVHWNAQNNIYGDSSMNRYIPDMDAIKQSLNLYVYCINNPVIYVDSYGAVAGDSFKSADKAAKDFAKTKNGMSIVNDIEYGTYIYSWEEEKKILWFTKMVTYYSYTEPFTNDKDDSLIIELNPSIPEGTIWVAIAHKHGAWKKDKVYGGRDWNDRFSDNDKNCSDYFERPIYLASPNGKLQEFDNSREDAFKVREIEYLWEMPHDKNHPKRKDNHKKACKNCFEEK